LASLRQKTVTKAPKKCCLLPSYSLVGIFQTASSTRKLRLLAILPHLTTLRHQPISVDPQPPPPSFSENLLYTRDRSSSVLTPSRLPIPSSISRHFTIGSPSLPALCSAESHASALRSLSITIRCDCPRLELCRLNGH